VNICKARQSLGRDNNGRTQHWRRAHIGAEFGASFALVGALLLGGCARRVSPPVPTLAASRAQEHGVEVEENEWWLRVAGGCNLYVHEVGRGPLIVVVHDGWGMEHSYLVDGFRRLANRYRFVFYDQRGSLRSPCDSLVDVKGHVDDLEHLRVALHLDRILLVGHGMGAYLAIKYAVAHPGHIAGLSLLAPISARGADVKLPTQAELHLRFARPDVVAEFRRVGLSTERSPTEPRARYLEHHIAKGAVYLYHVERWPDVNGTLFYNEKVSDAAGLPPVTEDLTPELAALPIPIQVLFPADDYLPVALSTRWVRDVPNAELTIIPEAGHLLWIDQPKIFASQLTSYFDRTVSRQRLTTPP
jgi:proline iminopeptidase